MNNALLVRLSISQWSARKLDRTATGKAKASAGATEKANVKVYKTVIAADALEAIDKIVNAARVEHKKRTVPYCYEGPGMITTTGYAEYKAVMATYEKEFHAAVAAFNAVYADERESAKSYLGAMFNAADYPNSAELASRFSFSVSAEPMPQADHFRPVGLAPELVAEIKQDIVQNNLNALEDANMTAWGRVIKSVELLKLRLEEFKRGDVKKFYASWVDNITELAGLIPSINVANDPILARMGQKLVALTAYSADELKADTNLCSQIATAAGIVLAQISEAHRNAA